MKTKPIRKTTGKHLLEPAVALRLGREIRRLRATQGLSLAELARLARLTSNYLSDLERGKRSRNPSLGILFAIAHGLQVGVSDLLGESRFGLGPEGQEAGRIIDAVPPTLQVVLLPLLRALAQLAPQREPAAQGAPTRKERTGQSPLRAAPKP